MRSDGKKNDGAGDTTILRRVAAARELHGVLAGAKPFEHRTAAPIEAYGTAIRRTSSAMGEMNVVAFCSRCAMTERGSCCFEEIGQAYDLPLLLLNLLLGCELPRAREIPHGCFFLGPTGCTLTARYHFCVNYLCPDLRNALGREGSERLLRIVGSEIAAGWEAEKEILRLMSTHPSGSGGPRGYEPSSADVRARTIS